MLNQESIIKIRLGKTGSGKTLDQTIEDVVPRLIAGEEIYSCYWLNWAGKNYHYFVADDFEMIKNVRNACIVFDEVAQSFEPRDWEKESSEVRRFFQLHRKRSNTIIANTQDLSLVAKTIGILAHEWILIEKIEPNWLDLILGNNKIKIDRSFMSYQRLKKLASGWEIGEIEYEKGEIEIDNKNYKEEDIIRRDLDEFKQELVHRYCPLCGQRQGEQILKEDTEKICEWNNKEGWKLKKEEYCPKHKNTLLEIRRSGMYDTNFEPEYKGRDVIFKPFIPSPAGWRLIEFKGKLTEEQKKEIEQLNKKWENKKKHQ
ncbi:MAG TPA: zonular occludens toxin domain-containing protein [bacterium]|nr:zonular occludens toxin domain-containing protein [bacterium]